MKFLTDRNLGKLTKWLRILGYDTFLYTGEIGRELLREGAKTGRVVLTRRRDMAERNFSGRMFIVISDIVADQLREVVDDLTLEIKPGNLFTICLNCNERLHDIPKADISRSVPPYVFQTQEYFRICRRCGNVFWPGTHKDNVFRFLTQHNLIHHL